jgi:hypothetical protein
MSHKSQSTRVWRDLVSPSFMKWKKCFNNNTSAHMEYGKHEKLNLWVSEIVKLSFSC